MERERSVDKLARYILYGFAFALIFVIGWYFKSVLVYIVVAAVVSLVAKPVMHGLSKVEIKGKVLPVWPSWQARESDTTNAPSGQSDYRSNRA